MGMVQLPQKMVLATSLDVCCCCFFHFKCIGQEDWILKKASILMQAESLTLLIKQIDLNFLTWELNLGIFSH